MATVETVANALVRAHRNSPHERAAQLMFNALDAQGLARMADGTPRDVFYVTNEALVNALHAYADMRFLEAEKRTRASAPTPTVHK